MTRLRDEVHLMAFGASAMQKKLALRRDKGDWRRIPLTTMMQLLRGELRELEEALETGDSELIVEEAIDVALYALFLADNVEWQFSDSTNEPSTPKKSGSNPEDVALPQFLRTSRPRE